MFDIMGVVIEAFIWFWIVIIAIIPNAFMGGLTACVKAMGFTYSKKYTPISASLEEEAK